MQELQKKVIQWAEDKGIFAKSDPISQFLKTISEVGELADAVNKNDLPEIKDAIGDITVTLILHAEMTDSELELNVDECVGYENPKEAVLYLIPDLLKIIDYEEYDDTIETLDAIAAHYDWTLQECLQSAYDIISKRTGSMQNGVFVKDS
jgi:NTP pyrophosphatase (non-canonical NTP hydrolase)